MSSSANIGKVCLLVALFLFGGLVNTGRSQQIQLDHWPEEKAREMEKFIQTLKKSSDDPYVVFDADNTLWEDDLEEALLPYLENRDIITRDNMDPSLKLVPFKKDESLFAYYYRLSAIDHKVGYPWIAQMFSGYTLQELESWVDQLFAYEKGIPVRYWGEDGNMVEDTVQPPDIYEAQRELVNTLQANGVEVYVVTAALEELVRMVVSDPKYEFNVKPENVIGVTTLLKDRETGEVTTARKQIEEGHFWDEEFKKSYHYSLELTPYLWTPATWYVGKMAGIKEYIHPVKRPMLVAGDSPNDHWMLFYSNVEKGGKRIWVNRKESYMKATRKAMDERFEKETAVEGESDARDGWIIAKPEELQNN